MDVNDPIARTAFYCCILRADDAARPEPWCNDTLAARFVDDVHRRDLAGALRLRNPAAANLGRHYIVDGLVRQHLAADPGRRVILLGAGFDTRAFRMRGGRWFEIDDPPLLAYKEHRLPAATCPNPLTRTPVAFDREAPDQYLGALAGDDEVLVVLEGVSMYLSDAALRALADAIVRHLPRATLVADMMSPRFAATFGRSMRKELAQLGAQFGKQSGHPSVPLIAAGLTVQERISMVERGREAGMVKIPRWLLNTALRELRDGYAVWTFRQSSVDQSSVVSRSVGSP